MKKIILSLLLLLTSICEATSQDGSIIYVDKDGWVIGANHNQTKEKGNFNLKKNSINSFSKNYFFTTNDEMGIHRIKDNLK